MGPILKFGCPGTLRGGGCLKKKPSRLLTRMGRNAELIFRARCRLEMKSSMPRVLLLRWMTSFDKEIGVCYLQHCDRLGVQVSSLGVHQIPQHLFAISRQFCHLILSQALGHFCEVDGQPTNRWTH